VVMHTPKTHPVVPPVDPADDDVGRWRRSIGVAVAEEPGEQGAEVGRGEVVGAQDDLLAEWGGGGDGRHFGMRALGATVEIGRA